MCQCVDNILVPFCSLDFSDISTSPIWFSTVGVVSFRGKDWWCEHWINKWNDHCMFEGEQVLFSRCHTCHLVLGQRCKMQHLPGVCQVLELSTLVMKVKHTLIWLIRTFQEEFVEGDEVGRLDCGHGYHTSCIKQWLLLKNLCPICKASAYSKCWYKWYIVSVDVEQCDLVLPPL